MWTSIKKVMGVQIKLCYKYTQIFHSVFTESYNLWTTNWKVAVMKYFNSQGNNPHTVQYQYNKIQI